MSAVSPRSFSPPSGKSKKPRGRRNHSSTSAAAGSSSRAASVSFRVSASQHESPAQSPAPMGPTTEMGPPSAVVDHSNNAEEEEEEDYGSMPMSSSFEDQDKLQTNLLLKYFDQEQMSRYEVYRRAGFNKASIKKLANQALGQSISANVAVVIAGFAKVFVGELVDEARRVQAEWGEDGPDAPLTPEHVREALRRKRLETNNPAISTQKVVFR